MNHRDCSDYERTDLWIKDRKRSVIKIVNPVDSLKSGIFFDGQYDEYDRCELPSYVYPVCKYASNLEDEYDLPFSGDFREQIKEITGKPVCKH